MYQKQLCFDRRTYRREQHKEIVANLLLDKGLNYGGLPKGLLRFHSYLTENRTPMQEHLVEGALYASNKSNIVNIHFTVSIEHCALFENHFNDSKTAFESTFGVAYNVSFSEQKPATDETVATVLFNSTLKIIGRNKYGNCKSTSSLQEVYIPIKPIATTISSLYV